MTRYPLTVVPAIGVSFPLSSGIVPRSRGNYSIDVVVRSAAKEHIDGTLRLELPPGWSSRPAVQTFAFGKEDEETLFTFEIDLPSGVREDSGSSYSIAAVAAAGGRQYRDGFQTITARDLSRLDLFRPAVHHVRSVDVELLGSPSVGYVAGSGDEVAESLQMLGLRPTLLSDKDLASGDLAAFDVILVGVRAYAVRPDLLTHNARLLRYVEHGGTLVVQYQTPEFDENFGPYPYEMGRNPEEVSEEDAQVAILDPEHPIMRSPNVITAEDFNGWVEQRGSKFWTTWDERYAPILECHDTGQSPQKGGLLVANYGQGTYVYAAYAWYRQLPAGVPGAFRIMANLLSLPETAAQKSP
jgi:hypothetical protein